MTVRRIPGLVLPRAGAVRVSPLQVVALLLIAGLAWAWTADASSGMGSMPGTMGRSLPSFVVMWALMMTAMMIPSAAPFASIHARTFDSRRTRRLALFAAGYLSVWVLTGIPAFLLALGVDEAVAASSTIGTIIAVLVFASCGVYQLTPLKYACLKHCRSPVGHVLHYGSYRGIGKDFRIGFHHGGFCLACCWSLMALMAAFGFMNLWTMIALAAIVAAEKYWVRGAGFARAVGVAALVAAVVVIWVPDLAPGLQPMTMS
jgi:predicted metal-binding membrane protein